MLSEELIWIKSGSILKKYQETLRKIPQSSFPSSDSEEAWKVLIKTTEELLPAALSAGADPAALYSDIQTLHFYILDLQRSNRGDLSWPIIWHCDEIRKKVFAEKNPIIFYSHTADYNYYISLFSQKLANELTNLKKTDKQVIKNKQIWALKLPDTELNNFTMYGNIAHELGHVYFANNIAEIKKKWEACTSAILSELETTLQTSTSASLIPAAYYINISRYVFESFKEEIFCDVFAAKLFGPLFYFSFFEMFYAKIRNSWSLTKTGQSSYPSPNFRLNYIANMVDLESFLKSVKSIFKTDSKNWEADYSKFYDTHAGFVRDEVHKDDLFQDQDGASVLKRVFTIHAAKIKKGITDYLEVIKSSELLAGIDCDMHPECWGELCERLAFGVTPNGILKNESKYNETPVGFLDVVIASLIFKNIIASRNHERSNNLVEEFDKISRLTEKALESIIIHERYNNKIL